MAEQPLTDAITERIDPAGIKRRNNVDPTSVQCLDIESTTNRRRPKAVRPLEGLAAYSKIPIQHCISTLYLARWETLFLVCGSSKFPLTAVPYRSGQSMGLKLKSLKL